MAPGASGFGFAWKRTVGFAFAGAVSIGVNFSAFGGAES